MTRRSSGLATRRVGQRIRTIRVGAGLTLETLAERTGMTPARISRVERGVQSPTVNTLERLADGLGVDLGSFFWTDPVAGRFGTDQIPEKVREIVVELVHRTDEDLLRAKILLHTLFAEATRLRDPTLGDPSGAAPPDDEKR